MSRKKWDTEIDLQETKTEQSQKLWRTETNVQNSIINVTITCILICIDSTQVFGIVSVQCYGSAGADPGRGQKGHAPPPPPPPS